MRVSLVLSVIGAVVLCGFGCDDSRILWELDQEFDPVSNVLDPAPYVGDEGLAQTFFSYKDSHLHSVALKLEGGIATPGVAMITVEFRETSGGWPAAVTLGSVDMDVANLPTTPSADFVWFDFRPFEIPVFNGTQYAIVVRRSAGVGNVARLHGASGNQFMGGGAFRQTGTNSFSSLAGDDFAFIEGVFEP